MRKSFPRFDGSQRAAMAASGRPADTPGWGDWPGSQAAAQDEHPGVRVLELTGKVSGSRVGLEGNRLPVTRSKDVIDELGTCGFAAGALAAAWTAATWRS